jgi:hypothetical protein
MPADPIHPNLWERAKTAIDAIRVVGHAWLAANPNPPRIQVPAFSTNSAGWPSVVETGSYGSSSGGGPIDWTELVGLNRGAFKKIGREDVPELDTFISYVRGESVLSSRLSRFRGDAIGDDFERQYFEIEVCLFLTRIITRAEALGTTDDGSMLSIYCQIERAKFAERLTTQLLVPLALTRLELQGTLEVAPGVRIETLDEDTQRARAVSTVFLDRVPAHLIAAATHAIVVDDVEIDNTHPELRDWRLEALNEGVDLSAVNRVIQAVHIASAKDTGYGQVCARPSDWADRWKADLPSVMSIRTPRHFPPPFAEGGWNGAGSHVDSEAVALIPTVYQALLSGSARVLLAARRIVSATTRSDDDDVTIDACIGIEALLGKEPDEVTHRLAQRAAVALSKGRTPLDPELVYGLVKAVYSDRSTVVHGAAERKRKPVVLGDTTWLPRQIATSILRALLLSWVEFRWTPDQLDSDLLRGLRTSRPETEAVDPV